MAALGRRIIDATNCKTVQDVAQALSDFHDAVLNPVPDPGPGPDGGVPPVYTPVYVDEDGNLTSGAVLTTVRIIAGLTTAVVTGPADFTIDGLVSLTEGFTVPAEPLSVVNTIGLSCGDNTAVYAIYRPDNDTWHTWTDTTAASASFTAGLGLTVTLGEFSLDDTGYNGSDALLYGSVAAAFQFDTVGNWLEYLTDYDDTAGVTQLIGHIDGNDPVWDSVGGWLGTLPDYDNATDNTQVVGHDGADPTAWFPMASLALGLAAADVASTASTFDGDTFTVLSGKTPSSTQTIDNPFGLSVDNNEDILIGRLPDADTWKLLFAALPSMAYGEATGPVSALDATFTADTFSPLCGKSPSASETIENTFGFTIDEDGKVLVVRFPGDATWHCWQAECPA